MIKLYNYPAQMDSFVLNLDLESRICHAQIAPDCIFIDVIIIFTWEQ